MQWLQVVVVVRQLKVGPEVLAVVKDVALARTHGLAEVVDG